MCILCVPSFLFLLSFVHGSTFLHTRQQRAEDAQHEAEARLHSEISGKEAAQAEVEEVRRSKDGLEEQAGRWKEAYEDALQVPCIHGERVFGVCVLDVCHENAINTPKCDLYSVGSHCIACICMHVFMYVM